MLRSLSLLEGGWSLLYILLGKKCQAKNILTIKSLHRKTRNSVLLSASGLTPPSPLCWVGRYLFIYL